MTKEGKSFQRVQTDSRDKNVISNNGLDGYSHYNPQYYEPTPPPTTVVVHSVPNKTNGACCWGCAAALCLCFGLEECCT